MEVKSKILSVLRVINVIVERLKPPTWTSVEYDLGFLPYPDEDDRYNKAKEYKYLSELLVKSGIEKEDYPTIAMILKSMALMTMASVETIRDPSGYDETKALTWADYFKSGYAHFDSLLTTVGVDLSGYPKKEDYQLAQKMVRVLGKSILKTEEVQNIFNTSGVQKEFDIGDSKARDMGLYGADVLYRGLKNLSANAFALLTTVGEEWDMDRGVSTSMIIEVAENFAIEDMHGTNKVVIVINNPKRQGFVADNLSGFNESEVILSGRLKIKTVAKADRSNNYITTVYADLL